MVRKAAFFVCLAAWSAGCAGPGVRSKAEQADLLDRVSRSQIRLEMRLDEVARNLLSLRERLDTQEVALKELAGELHEVKGAQAEPPEPPLTVVKVEPLPQEPPPPSAPKEASPSKTAAAVPEPQPAPADGAAADLYRRAFNGFRERRYGQAILDFEEFLRRHPEHEYADNAQYWIGESYYSQEQYEQAIVEFNRVLERYPDEGKAPDALLKIGLCYEKLGDAEKARVFWARLTAKFPESEAAHQARRHLQDQGRRQP